MQLPPTVGRFVLPAWWNKPAFAIRDIANALGVGRTTLTAWATQARSAGFVFGEKPHGRRLFSAHDAYRFCLLVRILRLRQPVTAETISAIFQFTTTPEGDPQPPGTAELLRLRPEGGGGVVVPAFLAWVTARAIATPKFGAAH